MSCLKTCCALLFACLLLAGCQPKAAPIPATISFISNRAEYTPPVIYSNAQRAKLVFMVEARPSPADGARLKPGQPIDVVLLAKAAS